MGRHTLSRIIGWIFLIMFCVTGGIRAEAATIEVSGNINQNNNWWSSLNTYIVAGTVTVTSGIMLYIEPGTEVKFDQGETMIIQGSLHAEGDVQFNAPKQTILTACKAKLITEEDAEIMLEMIDDRNMTSHMYKEEIANQVSTKIENYYAIIKKYADKLAA